MPIGSWYLSGTKKIHPTRDHFGRLEMKKPTGLSNNISVCIYIYMNIYMYIYTCIYLYVARYPIWGRSLNKNFGHVRDMVVVIEQVPN